MVYGYARVSTRNQRLDRQISNIMTACQSAIIKSEYYTGTTISRPEWEKLKKKLLSNNTVIFESVSRMSRNA